ASAAHHPLHSFPTRRSSDLDRLTGHPTYQSSRWLFPSLPATRPRPALVQGTSASGESCSRVFALSRCSAEAADRAQPRRVCHLRSEEHTSELQSQSNFVCRL